MHDPMTQAFNIDLPFGKRRPFMTIWHSDPERDGTDDSCGWFKRARHGDPAVLKKIKTDFEFDWDADYGGWFDKGGAPLMSASAKR